MMLRPGPLNLITDVPGLTVGMVTLNHNDCAENEAVRTGVTAILPRFDPLATARGGRPEGLDSGEDVADLKGPSGGRAPGLGVAP